MMAVSQIARKQAAAQRALVGTMWPCAMADHLRSRRLRPGVVMVGGYRDSAVPQAIESRDENC